MGRAYVSGRWTSRVRRLNSGHPPAIGHPFYVAAGGEHVQRNAEALILDPQVTADAVPGQRTAVAQQAESRVGEADHGSGRIG